MSDLNFSGVKVHNEIEYCMVRNPEVKKIIERAFLAHRISYYEKWDEPTFMQRMLGAKNVTTCTLCINGMQEETANQVMSELNIPKEKVKMIRKKINRTFFSE